MAGILHDAGKLVLDRFFSPFFGATLNTIREKGLHSQQVALETLGTTHTYLGGYLGLNWGFPEDLMEGITCQHDPSTARSNPKLASVGPHLLDQMIEAGEEQLKSADRFMDALLDRPAAAG